MEQLTAKLLKQLAHTALLPLALDGCARHAHLINVEMMNDLLRVLEKLLQSAATNPTMRQLPVRLKCILAGYRALRNQGYVMAQPQPYASARQRDSTASVA